MIGYDWESMFISRPTETRKMHEVDGAKLSSIKPLTEEIKTKITDTISWNRFNRDTGNTNLNKIQELLKQTVSLRSLLSTKSLSQLNHESSSRAVAAIAPPESTSPVASPIATTSKSKSPVSMSNKSFMSVFAKKKN